MNSEPLPCNNILYRVHCLQKETIFSEVAFLLGKSVGLGKSVDFPVAKKAMRNLELTEKGEYEDENEEIIPIHPPEYTTQNPFCWQIISPDPV